MLVSVSCFVGLILLPALAGLSLRSQRWSTQGAQHAAKLLKLCIATGLCLAGATDTVVLAIMLARLGSGQVTLELAVGV